MQATCNFGAQREQGQRRAEQGRAQKDRTGLPNNSNSLPATCNFGAQREKEQRRAEQSRAEQGRGQKDRTGLPNNMNGHFCWVIPQGPICLFFVLFLFFSLCRSSN